MSKNKPKYQSRQESEIAEGNFGDFSIKFHFEDKEPIDMAQVFLDRFPNLSAVERPWAVTLICAAYDQGFEAGFNTCQKEGANAAEAEPES
jgi:hypothetical protein